MKTETKKANEDAESLNKHHSIAAYFPFPFSYAMRLHPQRTASWASNGSMSVVSQDSYTIQQMCSLFEVLL